MKEQIIHLDPHDDYHSLRDKMGWAQTDRILLVLPTHERERLFKRQLDLLLIQRHAATLGAKLALVTDVPRISDYADTLGIPVFDSMDDSHLRPWRSRRPVFPKREERTTASPESIKPPQAKPLPRWLTSRWITLSSRALISIIALSAVIIMLTLTVPGAEIIIKPQGQSLNIPISIIADPSQIETDFSNHRIPARVASITLSTNVEVITTGSTPEATARAGGNVTFTNLTAQPVRIPAGTALRTTTGTPIRFVTQKDVTLEAQRGSSANAPVLAIEPGPPGNVGAGLINSIEGPLSAQAAVVNVDAMKGGDVKKVASVTEADRKNAKEQALSDLKQRGYSQLLAQLKEGEFAPQSSLRVIKIVSETYDHFVDEKTDHLALEMRVEVGITVVDERLAFAVGQKEIEWRLGDALALAPNSVSFMRDEKATSDDAGRIKFDITAKANASAAIDVEAIKQTARWQSVEQVGNLLYDKFPLNSRPEVKIFPSRFQRMPWLVWRIEVVIGN
ncbi:MAG: baseplate J/gp47 family protein [Chloroflexi bacterium]|nr:baseplate J/gp47 family protein [Chloroflexota bacterium]